jgi:hypothetical protein
MPRDIDAQQAWLLKQSKEAGPVWNNLCQSLARQAVSCPAWAPSAKQAWHAVNSKYRHTITRWDDKEWWASVPRGAILYSTSGSVGHAWTAAGDGAAWSNDYKRKGWCDKVPVNLPNWRTVIQSTVGWIDGCQWYDAPDHKFIGLRLGLWDGKVPPIDNILAAEADPNLRNAAAWRLACRLADLGHGGKKWVPVKYEQGYPAKAVAEANAKNTGMADPTKYGPKLHERLFG